MRWARTHLLVLRVEVGRALQAFHGGYVDRGRTRAEDGALEDFPAERTGPVADLGLHPQRIRQRFVSALNLHFHVLRLDGRHLAGAAGVPRFRHARHKRQAGVDVPIVRMAA